MRKQDSASFACCCCMRTELSPWAAVPVSLPAQDIRPLSPPPLGCSAACLASQELDRAGAATEYITIRIHHYIYKERRDDLSWGRSQCETWTRTRGDKRWLAVNISLTIYCSAKRHSDAIAVLDGLR